MSAPSHNPHNGRVEVVFLISLDGLVRAYFRTTIRKGKGKQRIDVLDFGLIRIDVYTFALGSSNSALHLNTSPSHIPPRQDLLQHLLPAGQAPQCAPSNALSSGESTSLPTCMTPHGSWTSHGARFADNLIQADRQLLQRGIEPPRHRYRPRCMIPVQNARRMPLLVIVSVFTDPLASITRNAMDFSRQMTGTNTTNAHYKSMVGLTDLAASRS
jgi:hypothetical protein